MQIHQPTSSMSETSRSIAKRNTRYIIAGQLFDSQARVLVPNQLITVDKDRGIILDVREYVQHEKLPWALGEIDTAVEWIDLSGMTVLPGFVDVHVHLFLHPYTETSWNDQLTKESLAERTLRASVHARKTLLAGFTTVRDLGTEGAFDADLALRKCMAGRGAMIKGPRYFCANRAIVPTGAYGPKSVIYPGTEGIEGVMGAEVADGREGCIRAVRRQIGAGADWIKVYADYRVRSRISDVFPREGARSIPTFNQDELEAMISTAHSLGVKVAAHANTARAIDVLLDLGVDSIEHGAEMYDGGKGDDRDGWMRGDMTLIDKFAHKPGTTWVPTLAAYYTIAQTTDSPRVWEEAQRTYVRAIERMDNLACGGDTGVFAHGENGLEMVLMRRLGAAWERVLAWGTEGGWKCVRGREWDGDEGLARMGGSKLNWDESPLTLDGEREVPFGVVKKGWAADFVGIEGVVNGSVEEFERAVMGGVSFVMKGGTVYKRNGVAVAEEFV